MSCTIKDIAKELGISTTSVSLVINNKDCRISQATRDSIMNLVKKYGYTPNSNARALVTKRTNTIGFIVPDISNPFFAELAKGVERSARKAGYSIILCNSNDSSKNDIKNLKLLISKRVDGIIISPSFNSSDNDFIAEFNRIVHQNKLPIILVDRKIPGHNFDIALIDHRMGSFIATQHLLELGHTMIGCITGPLDDYSCNERYIGYVDALHMFNLDVDPKLVYSGNYQVDSGVEGAKKLIANGASAIFSCNDLMALGVIRQARLMGKTIGKDLSLVGFDDIPICDFVEPPLTTVHQPVYDMGENAFQLVMNLISSPNTMKQYRILSPTLVVRETTCKNGDAKKS